MARIIPLPNSDIKRNKSKREDNFTEIISYFSEMNNVLFLIEKSLENTPNYVSKNLNS